MAAQRTYLAIDLKSFYASVECVDRHLDPLTTNLVVADASRTEKTICLAVSPSLKAYKIPGRARLFEAVQRVKEVNAQRLQTAIRQKKAVRGEDGKYHFARTSFDANALNADPALGLSYIVAPPRMQRYLDVSTQIYKTYLKYVSPADIYPYSIDEVFIDVTGYLPYYHMSAHELAMTMVRECCTTPVSPQRQASAPTSTLQSWPWILWQSISRRTKMVSALQSWTSSLTGICCGTTAL